MYKAGTISKYLKSQASLNLLRFITCGSVDDGKSTLIGRMLYESQMIFDDQVASLKNDSKKYGTQGGNIDFALLVDGLSADKPSTSNAKSIFSPCVPYFFESFFKEAT